MCEEYNTTSTVGNFVSQGGFLGTIGNFGSQIGRNVPNFGAFSGRFFQNSRIRDKFPKFGDSEKYAIEVNTVFSSPSGNARANRVFVKPLSQLSYYPLKFRKEVTDKQFYVLLGDILTKGKVSFRCF